MFALSLLLLGSIGVGYFNLNPNYLVIKLDEMNKINSAFRFLFEKVKRFEETAVVEPEISTENELTNNQILVVTATKAKVREGPSEDSKTFMHIAGGSRVIAIGKQDSWYQIYTPNGVLAWISEGVVGGI